jgi:hypothetical protein
LFSFIRRKGRIAQQGFNGLKVPGYCAAKSIWSGFKTGSFSDIEIPRSLEEFEISEGRTYFVDRKRDITI